LLTDTRAALKSPEINPGAGQPGRRAGRQCARRIRRLLSIGNQKMGRVIDAAAIKLDQ
jgi:hypothetical protein